MAFSFFRWEALERWKDDSNLTEAQWDTVRALGIVGGLALIGAVGYWGGQPLWSHWQSRQALAQSREFAAKKDYPSMFLALRRATNLAPRDRFVWEETARALAQVGSPEELTAREELTRLSPGDKAIQLAFGQEALRFGRYDSVHTALDAMAAAGQTDLAYQRLAVALAVAEGQTDRMKAELKKLIALEPSNLNAQFSYAALTLWGSDPAATEAARVELDHLLDDRSTRIRSMVQLVADAARRGTPARVNAVIVRGLAVFAPTVPITTIHTETQGWETLLQGMKAAAPPSPTDTGLLARWLGDMGRRAEALTWLRGLPADLRHSGPVSDLTAELAAEDKNDEVLRSALAEGAWGIWPPDAWSRAIEHRRQSEHPAPGVRPVSWTAAITACGDSLDGLRNLARLASAWKRPSDAEAAWLAILDRAPSLQWVYSALQYSDESRQDWSALNTLYARWAQQFPADDKVAERWLTLASWSDHLTSAATSRSELLPVSDLASKVAKAAVLWRRGRSFDAEKLLAGLTTEERATRDGSFWLALIESDLGHPQAADEAIAAAREYTWSKQQDLLLSVAAKKARLNLAR